MTKGKSKSAVAPNVKSAIGTAALLASGASAKGLRESGAGDEEAVVASFDIASKRALNDDPPPNLTVAEKVIAETAPFQMIRQKRSMEVIAEAGADVDAAGEKKSKKKKKVKKDDSDGEKKKKKKDKKKDSKKDSKKDKKTKVRQLGMEPPEESGSSLSEGEQ